MDSTFTRPMTTNHCKLVAKSEGFPHISHIATKASGNVRSCNKLKTVNLHYHYAYSHQTCQGSDIPLGALTHRVA